MRAVDTNVAAGAWISPFGPCRGDKGVELGV